MFLVSEISDIKVNIFVSSFCYRSLMYFRFDAPVIMKHQMLWNCYDQQQTFHVVTSFCKTFSWILIFSLEKMLYLSWSIESLCRFLRKRQFVGIISFHRVIVIKWSHCDAIWTQKWPSYISFLKTNEVQDL